MKAFHLLNAFPALRRNMRQTATPMTMAVAIIPVMNFQSTPAGIGVVICEGVDVSGNVGVGVDIGAS